MTYFAYWLGGILGFLALKLEPSENWWEFPLYWTIGVLIGLSIIGSTKYLEGRWK